MSYTIIGKPLAEFIRGRIETRNLSLAQRQDLNVAVDPEILEVIKASTAVATSTGSSAHLLKIGSKRRRTRAEIDEYRAQREQELVSVADQAQRIKELERQITQSKSKL